MSKRSNWCEFDKDTRKYIKKRDKEECVICHKKGATQIMHIFLSRAKGGKGCKENGCLGCVKCHQIIDNPIGKEHSLKSAQYMEIARNYLIEQEHIEDIDNLMKKLKFDKTKMLEKETKIVYNNKCRDCMYLIKAKIPKTTFSHYYCKYKKINITKNTMACDKFRR